MIVCFIIAIAAMKDEIMRFRNSDSVPVLEEFMSLKKISPAVKDEKVDDDRGTDNIIVYRRENELDELCSVMELRWP